MGEHVQPPGALVQVVGIGHLARALGSDDDLAGSSVDSVATYDVETASAGSVRRPSSTSLPSRPVFSDR